MSSGRADRSVPAVVAGAGPFEITSIPLSMGGRSSLPSGVRSGIFMVPAGADAESIGIRQHEYGHLAVESSGLLRRGILKYLVRNGIAEFWAQAGLDCIVNGYMLGVGCAEIASLKPCEFPPPAETPRFLLATIYLRCVLLNCAEAFRPLLIDQGRFDPIEAALLDDTANRLASNGRNGVRVPPKVLLEEISALQAIFGPHPWSTNGKFLDATENSQALDRVLKQGIAAAPICEHARWGELEQLIVPHNKTHIPARTALRRKPGFTGPLRFPHRAVMGGDGQAFAHTSRTAAGTALIDCSGSMNLTEETVRKLMSRLPAIEIALYAGFPQNPHNGWLCVIARSGRLGDISTLVANFGGYNVVDGPALKWLGNRRGPRFWISDGAVNGCGGAQSKSLFVDVANLVRDFRIERLDNTTALLDSQRSRQI